MYKRILRVSSPGLILIAQAMSSVMALPQFDGSLNIDRNKSQTTMAL
jgi:hypothetical protein